jgi:hypothetical protein
MVIPLGAFSFVKVDENSGENHFNKLERDRVCV